MNEELLALRQKYQAKQLELGLYEKELNLLHQQYLAIQQRRAALHDQVITCLNEKQQLAEEIDGLTYQLMKKHNH